jgi:hypothetical protein
MKTIIMTARRVTVAPVLRMRMKPTYSLCIQPSFTLASVRKSFPALPLLYLGPELVDQRCGTPSWKVGISAGGPRGEFWDFREVCSPFGS